MSTATERLQKTLLVLRSKLADERGFYLRNKSKFELYYPNEWKIVHASIVAVAQYYHGEIVRAKHDLADWMNGHEVHGTYADLDAVDMIHEMCGELGTLLEDATAKAGRYNQEKADPLNAGAAKMEYDEALGEVQACLDLMSEMQKVVEEKTYAER